MSNTSSSKYVAVTTALEAGLPIAKPTTYSEIDAICDVMRADGRDELVHYAGACYRDTVAWQMVLAWAADRTADEAMLKSRALQAAGWGYVSPDDIRASRAH